MKAEPRVAFFTDSYLEVNGVAHTSRMLAGYAQRRELPFLCVHAAEAQTREHLPRVLGAGSLTCLALPRTKLGFALDADLRFDLLLWRHAARVLAVVRDFNPDVIHITGPSDVGLLGALVAWRLQLPLVISWHTNVHEYAGQRLGNWLRWVPVAVRQTLTAQAERFSLRALLQFYRLGHVSLAPHAALAEMLERQCGKPCFLMRRGVNAELFSPVKRQRRDSVFTLGYVGRLTPEKDVRSLVAIARQLQAAGHTALRFVIVGAGSEADWLKAHLPQAEFTGVLKGEALARAYANLDLFLFPSRTDTFGNVVLEAQASGVPAIVSTQGGPQFIIRHGETGIVAATEGEFADAALQLITDRDRLQRMREAARALACQASWEDIFAQVYAAYAAGLSAPNTQTAPSVPATSARVNAHANR